MPDSSHSDGKPHPIADKVDSTLAKVLARWVWPAIMAILGFLIVDKLRGVEVRLDAASARSLETAHELTEVGTRIALLNARLDDRVIRQVDDNKVRIDEHEKRLQTIERVVKVP